MAVGPLNEAERANYKVFMVISNWKKAFGLFTQIFQRCKS